MKKKNDNYVFDLELYKNGFSGIIAESMIKDGITGKVYKYNKGSIVLKGDLKLKKGKLSKIMDLLYEVTFMNGGCWEGYITIRNETETKTLIAPRFVEQKQLDKEERSNVLWNIFWWMIAFIIITVFIILKNG
jgi:hypothetical protein